MYMYITQQQRCAACFVNIFVTIETPNLSKSWIYNASWQENLNLYICSNKKSDKKKIKQYMYMIYNSLMQQKKMESSNKRMVCIEIPFSSYPVLISVSIKNKFQRGLSLIYQYQLNKRLKQRRRFWWIINMKLRVFTLRCMLVNLWWWSYWQ